MKARLLGVGIALLGLACLFARPLQVDGIEQHWTISSLWFATAGASLLALGVLLVTSASTNATTALLRLDHFLRFLRKPKKGTAPPSPSWSHLLLARILPRDWLSDKTTGKPGAIRKLFKRVGVSLLSAPARRIVQAICFAIFLILFHYVCWPYSAKPVADAQQSPEWQLQRLDQETGTVTLQSVHATQFSNTTSWLNDQQNVHILDASTDPPTHAGTLKVNQLSDDSIELLDEEGLTLETFLLSSGPFTIADRNPADWPSHYTDDLQAKEFLPAESFLVIDPLVSLSTALAARSWVWSLGSAGAILIACVLVPRGFCGYLCPLGTLIDLFDWSIGKRVNMFRVPGDGWWVHIKYYLLLATLICSFAGILVSGYVAAIPVITRGLLFITAPLQTGAMRGWHQVPAMNVGHIVSLLLFATVFGLGFLRPRFWCKYVCPSGAVFSLGNLFRLTERKVESTCINCNKCVEVCPFDAIKPDFTTRTSDCTMCQTCGGVCPTQAIKFVDRGNLVQLKVVNDPPTNETSLGRRGFLSLVTGSAAAVAGAVGISAATNTFGANLRDEDSLPVRPPGSVPEQEFLQMCIRCGECYKACPNHVLQPLGFEQGLEGLWTPQVVADWAGCASSCNACGQVCPTGAIRALPLVEKKVARMGLAIVNQTTCLPLANKEACQLCVDECQAAGYDAIEFMQVHTSVDDDGLPLEGTGFLAPVVLDDKCVGCGLCQTRCFNINVKDRHVLDVSAIIIKAGTGKEDRLMDGSYSQLRHRERESRAQESRAQERRKQRPQSPNDNPLNIDEPEDSNPFGVDSPF
ncbi:MAG: NAD-dependent dihydropyrimidine dehydrogenase PreA subunit [Pirellulaceae bacterium]|jgi:NAD-dependent dihydropyrimidine dehydrogenase PreA subunit